MTFSVNGFSGAYNRGNILFGNLNSDIHDKKVADKEQQFLKKQIIKQQYNDIFEHEKKHKDAAGSLGGPIVIENNSQGIPVQGHVNIKMPVLNKANPDKTIEHADTVIKSAMAPSDPSGQDYKVAAEAKSIKSQALQEKNHPSENTSNKEVGKNLNFVA